MAKITFEDKVTLNENQDIANVNKGRAADWNEVKRTVNTNTPIGVVQMYAGLTAPTGWLICDGSEISRTEFADLFSVIGTAFGAGDGSTTFNIPDMRNLTPVGLDSNDEDFNVLGKVVGSKKHTHLNGMYSASSKLCVSNNNSDPGHSVSSLYSVTGTSGFVNVSNTQAYAYSTEEGTTIQPSMVLNYIISY